MSLEIIDLQNEGDEKEEYLRLRVTADVNLSQFLVLDATFTADGSPSNKQRHPYWFASKEVKKGDFVWLYTKKGIDSARTNKADTTTHLIYWGLDKPVWNNTGDTAVLFRISGKKALTKK
jgi:hypothetical protein